MSLSKDDVRKIAKLSRIALTDEQVDHFQEELTSIFDWIEMLQEVDTDNVPQLASVSDTTLPHRKDEVTDGGYAEQVLDNAPMTSFQCYVVPKVVE
ncbi:MAG: Asp-tRNA(Asn)/Glu-tRNA(Gln) amidotransferase subunit GatC [Rickettsiales bacterium]|nr:Asp-tRNA(Asn)/Glu-tRNA(Gln) amidotransferase subunit GatC [Rickettsiales bacterium]